MSKLSRARLVHAETRLMEQQGAVLSHNIHAAHVLSRRSLTSVGPSVCLSAPSVPPSSVCLSACLFAVSALEPVFVFVSPSFGPVSALLAISLD